MADREAGREERAWWSRIALPAAGLALLGLVALVSWLLLRPEVDELEPIRTVNEAGDTIVYSGRVRDAVARARIVEALNSSARAEDAAGEASPGDSAGHATAARDARQAAVDELARLYADPADPEAVVAAMNLAIIDFEAGAADLPSDAAGFIQGAAEVIERVPDGTVIVVAGYVNTAEESELEAEEGAPEAVAADLGARRARAVIDALVEAGADDDKLRAVARDGAPPRATEEPTNGIPTGQIFFELAELAEPVEPAPAEGDPDEGQADSPPDSASEASPEASIEPPPDPSSDSPSEESPSEESPSSSPD